jgi:predicted RNA-binding protein with PIN domain
MRILIDGYNLLHASGIFADAAPRRGTELASARTALLRFLAERLEPHTRRQTVVVFDASAAPRGLPRHEVCFDLQVHYAVGFPEADALLEELIRRHHAPRQLTVVSSDHRVQRAARRRRAAAVDSQRWLKSLVAQKHATQAGAQPAKPSSPPGEDEVQYWLRQFAAAADAPSSASPPLDEAALQHCRKEDEPRGNARRRRKPAPEPPADDLNPYAPFSPDYFDDLQF